MVQHQEFFKNGNSTPTDVLPSEKKLIALLRAESCMSDKGIAQKLIAHLATDGKLYQYVNKIGLEVNFHAYDVSIMNNK